MRSTLSSAHSPMTAKNIYMFKIFEEGSHASALFESGFHWYLKKDAVAALKAMKAWYNTHTLWYVEARLFCDQVWKINETMWEQQNSPHEVDFR